MLWRSDIQRNAETVAWLAGLPRLTRNFGSYVPKVDVMPTASCAQRRCGKLKSS